MKEILNRISKEGLVLDVKNGELQIFSTKDEVDDKLISEIKSRKKELITYLIRYKKSSLQSTKYQEIPKCDEKESYPISNSQYRIWLASQMEDGSIAYNMPDTIVLDGAYDVDCFQKSVYAVIDRHEILRTVFKMNELGEVRQFISSAQDFNFSIDFQDFRKRDDPKVAYEKYVSIDSRKPFDLAQGPLLRASLIRLSEEQYLFYYNMHHIISDGWSMDVLSRDVMQYYKAYVSDVSPNLSPLRIQYKDYATWQLSELDGPSFKEHKEYWFSQFCEEIPAIDLPKQKRRPKVKTYNGKSIGTYIPEELTTKLRNFTKERGGSLFIGLLTVWKTLLYRYTGESHITVGNMITGREHPDLEGQIGFYINALALRNQIDPKDSFKAFYEKVKANTLKAYKYQTYPFDKLIEDLDVQRDISRNPLFEIVVNYHGVSDTDIAFEELQDFGDSLVKFDLIYGATEVSGGINLQLGYNTDVYDQEMVEGLLVHYKRLLTLFLENPERCIGTVTFLSDKESTRLLNEFNTFQIGDSQSYNIVDLFSSQCHKTPDATAVVFEAESLTYKELDERSNQLAHYLQNCGVTRDTLVPICVSSSLDSIVGMLGIIKSGGVYVPIDQDCPQQRLDFILEDTGCKQLLSHSDLSSIFEEYEEDIELIYMDSLDVLEDFSVLPLDISIDPSQLLYVIYTSGTTGVPKGVLIEHKSLAYYILCQTQYFGIEPDDTFVLLANTAFDASIEQIFLAILNGGKLVIPKKSDILDNESFLELLSSQRVTHLHGVPSFLRAVDLRSFHFLRRIVSAGEPFDIDIFQAWLGDVEIYNKYGPTEATISATEYKVSDQSYHPLSIGKPIGRTQCYILGEGNTLQPEGVIGEICISGMGLARGYLNRSELTEERFVENPFINGALMYKTGDLGSWLPDGSIAFHGRKDHQVKIRGYRIELEEIESVLNALYNIEQAVVMAVSDHNDTKQLVAYVVSNELVDSNSIKEGLMLLLEEKLPEYMVPSIYVKLDKLPLSPNGKIDRKALPIPDIFYKQKDYVAPSSVLEVQLVEIWQEVLGIEKIGIHDDFFELGGHSLSAIKLSFAIKKACEVKIEMNTIFKYSTIELQSQYISIVLSNTNDEKLTDEEVIYF